MMVSKNLIYFSAETQQPQDSGSWKKFIFLLDRILTVMDSLFSVKISVSLLISLFGGKYIFLLTFTPSNNIFDSYLVAPCSGRFHIF
jgi:hypothetical protein